MPKRTYMRENLRIQNTNKYPSLFKNTDTYAGEGIA